MHGRVLRTREVSTDCGLVRIIKLHVHHYHGAPQNEYDMQLLEYVRVLPPVIVCPINIVCGVRSGRSSKIVESGPVTLNGFSAKLAAFDASCIVVCALTKLDASDTDPAIVLAFGGTIVAMLVDASVRVALVVEPLIICTLVNDTRRSC